MKRFNLEEYLANPSRKVVTRDGRNVRIICTDAKGGYPVVALIEEQYSNRESIYTFTKNGCWSISDIENINDLFFAPEKKEGWINIYHSDSLGRTSCNIIYSCEKDAKYAIVDSENYIATIKIEWEE